MAIGENFNLSAQIIKSSTIPKDQRRGEQLPNVTHTLESNELNSSKCVQMCTTTLQTLGNGCFER